MGLETGDTIYDLNAANPPGSDSRSQGDDHIRLIKSVLQGTFLKGTTAGRPAAGTMGRYYLDTDDIILYYDDGANWQRVGSGLSDLLTGETISGDDTLVASDGGQIKYVDTSGGDVTITLPAEADAGIGWWVVLVKTSDSNDLIVVDDGASTVHTGYYAGEAVKMHTDASSWFADMINEVYPFAEAYLNGAQSINDSTWTQVDYDTEITDTHGMLANAELTIRKPGQYMVFASLSLVNAGDGDDCMLVAAVDNDQADNNAMPLDEFDGPGVGVDEVALAGSTIMNLAATDTVQIYVHQATGGSRSILTGRTVGNDISPRFSARFMGRTQ